MPSDITPPPLLVVAGAAVGGHTATRLVLVLVVHVASDTPAHLEGRELIDLRHPLHLAVTLLALELAVHHVAHVRKADERRHAMDLGPLDGLVGRVRLAQLLHLGITPPDDQITS